MNHFEYRNGSLFCEELSLQKIAEEVGTPCYVYSHATLSRHFRVFSEALAGMPHLICYSVKANSNGAVLSSLAALGSGADIVSGGELFRAVRAGIPAEKIVFSGVGKQAEEIEAALRAKILLFNVESRGELLLIEKIATHIGMRAPISLRVNPDVDPGTHPYISTGLQNNKFGIPVDEAWPLYEEAMKMNAVDIRGIDCHIGSQLMQIDPIIDSLKPLVKMAGRLVERGVALEYLDVGGGLGIRYDTETPPSPAEYGRCLKKVLTQFEELGLTLICEPGRVIMGNAGVMLSHVLFHKRNGEKHFVIIDAAMNDLLRPSLYNAFHGIRPVKEHSDPVKNIVDVVGPICESGDFLAHDRPLANVEEGELLAVGSAGAYGYTMSSNYNSRPRAAEVLVRGDRWAVVREREKEEDLIRGESVPEWTKEPLDD